MSRDDLKTLARNIGTATSFALMWCAVMYGLTGHVEIFKLAPFVAVIYLLVRYVVGRVSR